MLWLSDLVDSDEGSLDVLPVQCLCEFLLMSHTDHNGHDSKTFKHSQVLLRSVSHQVLYVLLLCSYFSHHAFTCEYFVDALLAVVVEELCHLCGLWDDAMWHS